MLRAKILILCKAPPEKRFIIPKILAPELEKNFFNTSLLIPGTGTKVPNLYKSKMDIVKKILFFNSKFEDSTDTANKNYAKVFAFSE